VFGGLVWILISSSLVPIPLVQGWVMFVSVFCFVTTTLLLFLYVIGAHGSGTFWITLMTLLMATKATSDLGNVTTDDTSQDAAYHCVASLFYFGASVLEAFATIQMQDGFRYKQYHENISAVVSPQSTCHVHGSHHPLTDRLSQRLPRPSLFFNTSLMFE
ncbi:Myelin and lymphocyte protein, partial [Camelus dromedarius]